MFHELNEKSLIVWSNQWDLLSKVQKRLISLLEESPRVGNFSDIVKFCGINVNNQTFNTRQIKLLADWEIITISDYDEKDKDEIKHQIGIAINSRTKTFRLTENWVEKIYSLNYNTVKGKKI